MAKIRDQEEQRKALKNINSSIRDLNAANEFLKAQNTSGVYTITFTGDDGVKYSRDIKFSKEELNSRVMNHKAQEKQRIQALADEHGIDLDEKDIEILNFSL